MLDTYGGILLGNTTVSMNHGIVVEYRTKTFALDPRSSTNADYVFMSHAHIDHICSNIKNNLISSKETVIIARERGFNLPDPIDFGGIELFDSCHIVGSKSILISDDVFYTGDIALRPRAFLNAPKIPKAKTLVIETTYGSSRYSFPSPATVVDEANKLISGMYSKGMPAILCGYVLGKAQVLSYLFSSWSPIYVSESIKKMNDVCSSLGVPLKSFISYQEAKKEGLLGKRPWVMIAPSNSSNNVMVSYLKKKYGAVTFSFTGWAVDGRFGNLHGQDYHLPLSDHCDFNDLIKIVKKVDPERVYTVHGFSTEFASILRSMGYEARALTGSQSNITDFSSHIDRI